MWITSIWLFLVGGLPISLRTLIRIQIGLKKCINHNEYRIILWNWMWRIHPKNGQFERYSCVWWWCPLCVRCGRMHMLLQMLGESWWLISFITEHIKRLFLNFIEIRMKFHRQFQMSTIWTFKSRFFCRIRASHPVTKRKQKKNIPLPRITSFRLSVSSDNSMLCSFHFQALCRLIYSNTFFIAPPWSVISGTD